MCFALQSHLGLDQTLLEKRNNRGCTPLDKISDTNLRETLFHRLSFNPASRMFLPVEDPIPNMFLPVEQPVPDMYLPVEPAAPAKNLVNDHPFCPSIKRLDPSNPMYLSVDSK